MKVTEHIRNANGGTGISFEILPPLKGKTIESIYNHLDPLMEFNPAFINVTYHRSEQVFKKRADGSFEKVEIRSSVNHFSMPTFSKGHMHSGADSDNATFIKQKSYKRLQKTESNI